MMDTSDTYVLMCRKAAEIQAACPFEQGDFILNTSAVRGTWLFVNHLYQPYHDRADWELLYRREDRKDFNVWLPRQDQLQAMLEENDYPLPFMDLIDWTLWYEPPTKKKPNPLFVLFTSMEQLWIAFVMHEKFNKRWAGSDWVKDKS